MCDLVVSLLFKSIQIYSAGIRVEYVYRVTIGLGISGWLGDGGEYLYPGLSLMKIVGEHSMFLSLNHFIWDKQREVRLPMARVVEAWILVRFPRWLYYVGLMHMDEHLNKAPEDVGFTRCYLVASPKVAPPRTIITRTRCYGPPIWYVHTIGKECYNRLTHGKKKVCLGVFLSAPSCPGDIKTPSC